MTLCGADYDRPLQWSGAEVVRAYMGSDREKEEERTDLSYTMKADLSGFSEFGFQYIDSKGFGATQAEVCCWIKGIQEAS